MTYNNSPKLINVVGTGSLSRQLDLDQFREDMDQFDNTTNANILNSFVSIEFSDIDGKLIVYESGKYSVMGCKSVKKAKELNKTFLRLALRLEIIDSAESKSICITNKSYTVDLNTNIDLEKLNILLADDSEYEPEQYSFVIYKPENIDGTVTISNSGKCVIITPRDENTVCQLATQILNHVS
jgi:transcription initiation factor TFIID TATA-box-binding protein